MSTNERREKILKSLSKETGPVSASTLAKKFNVSRQVIVGDIALLRAEDHKIEATPRGYILNTEGQYPYKGVLAMRHGSERLEEELLIIVDNGGTCIDVRVDHPVYGEIRGMLEIASRYDVKCFMEKMSKAKAPLSILSEGVHLHSIGCKDKETFERIKEALKVKDFLFSA